MNSSALMTSWVAYRTLARKEIKRFMRIWLQTLLPPVITMTLYLLIFGNLIGSRVGEMGGHRYMDFIAPGVIMMAIITNSYSNVASSFFSARFQRFIEELLISPTPNAVILLGYMTGGITRGLLVGGAVTVVAMTFTDLRITSIGITVSVVFLTSALFSLAGFLNGLFAKNFDDVSIVPTFILTPFTYLGGVFYSIELLPEFWQTISLGNPILYMVNAFRFGILGVSDIDVVLAFFMILTFVVLLFCFALGLLNRGFGIRS